MGLDDALGHLFAAGDATDIKKLAKLGGVVERVRWVGGYGRMGSAAAGEYRAAEPETSDDAEGDELAQGINGQGWIDDDDRRRQLAG